MTDIFHEIEEDLRRERLRKLWERFGGLLIGLVALVVLGTAAWSGYQYWRHQQAVAASAAYADALTLAAGGKPSEAEAALTVLAASAPSGYRTLARFGAAAAAAARDPAAGIAAYDALAGDTSLTPTLRDVARVRAGLLLVDRGNLAEVAQRVEPVIAANGELRGSAREILALAQLKAGDAAAAQKTAVAIAEDPDSPSSMRSRAELIRRLTASAAGASGLPATQ